MGTQRRTQIRKQVVRSVGWWSLAIAAWLLLASSVSAGPQASITLKNSDAALCQSNNTAWTLTKESDVGNEVDSGDTVTWTVGVTRGATTDNDLAVYGFMQVTNTGSAPATIGNIVVNLQRTRYINKKTGSKWVSASVNVADATSGDAATSAKILAAGSQENVTWNAMYNSPLATYAVTSPRGTFLENAASGALTFTDADSNDVWALTPQKSIGVGETVNLLFQSHFNNSILLIPAGEQVRAEVIVTFGNAGARGGSGAVGSSIDINGNGSTDLDEAKIRSVPTRLTRTVPALEACNDSVYLSDFVGDVTTTGDATFVPENFVGLGEWVSGDGTFSVGVGAVDGGEAGGSITNTAHLDGVSDEVSVIIGYESVYDEMTMTYNSVPIYYDFPCCVGVDIDAANTVTVLAEDVPPPPSFAVDDYCTYLRNAYGDPSGGPSQTDAQVLYALYSTHFPSGLTIGVNDGAGASHHAFWDTASGGSGGISRLRNFLNNSSGVADPNGALTADDSNNATTVSGGLLAKQTATLTLNVGFSDAGVAGDPLLLPLGDLELCDLEEGDMIGTWTLTAVQATALNGQSIGDILADANTALGTGVLPSYVDPAVPATFDGFDELNELVTALNLSFNDCVPSGFAQAHLCPKPVPAD